MARALLFGTPVSPGIAIGTVRFMHRMRQDEERRIRAEQVAAEQDVLRAAAADVRAALQATMENVPEDLAEYRDVIAAQMEIVRDPKLLNAALARIARKQVCAAWALKLTVDELCTLFRGMDDPYLRDRAQDIRAVGLRLRDRLSADPAQDAGSEPGVLAAEDLSPADVMELDLDKVLGIVTTEGGPTSHTAILSRGLHIPGLAGVTGLVDIAREREPIIVDGLGGCVLQGPDEATWPATPAAGMPTQLGKPAPSRPHTGPPRCATACAWACRPTWKTPRSSPPRRNAAPTAWACTAQNLPILPTACPRRKTCCRNTPT
jgi:phosphotransferase system enzyme I (PtsI)